MDWDDMTGLLTRRQVCEITGFSRTTLWRYVDEKLFPAPRSTPTGRLVWLVGEVYRWIHELPLARKGARGKWLEPTESPEAPQATATPPTGSEIAFSGPPPEGHQ